MRAGYGFPLFRLVLGALVCAIPLPCRVGGQTPAVAPSANGSVSGIVYDSLGKMPLAAARVELADAERLTAAPQVTATDSLGRFRFPEVPNGRYLIGFAHPMLDSLGLEPVPREVVIRTPTAIRTDLALPSALSVRRTLCGDESIDASDALILGYVRAAQSGAPVQSAEVHAEWSEHILDGGRLVGSMARRTEVTKASGWFAICGAPINGSVGFSATRGVDSTPMIQLEIPSSGFLRRDLYFGASRTVAAIDTDAGSDSALAPRVLRAMGNGRLRGVVVARATGRPIAGARVGLLDGVQTRTDDTGAWSLSGLPMGTRMLEVRAVAHFPETLPVDVIEGAAPVRVTMNTMQFVMDTVRVSARRMGNSNLAEFQNRRRVYGAGRFITSDDIALRNPVSTGDLFASTLGVALSRDESGRPLLNMRGGLGPCRPAVFLNRMTMRDITLDDLSSMVRPNEILGIEIYASGASPAEYQSQDGCGSVVIWTR